jgi:hypothetical protein
MSDESGFDAEGVSIENPHLRRVTEILTQDTEIDIEVEPAEPYGVWIPLEATQPSFTMRVEEPGVITVNIFADGRWGVEWRQDR